ncbi:MAG: ATP-binding protein [Gemmatimonadetes bacterium]|nr:ATP-binding protein [Gemmatimonadota bacterium]
MLDGRFRFDNFVIGAANRLASSAARAVADAPGAAYNPLFIYSSSGLGKTHLLGAIGHHARQLHPGLAIEYLTLDDFVSQLHQAIATGQADGFKRRYAGVGLLLLDDVQFLTGRVETQSEVLRVFNALQGSGRQIVMTCDRPPTEISDVDERLISRLAGGLIVDVGVPDYETRVAILRSKCGDRGVRFAAGVLEELARTPATNVRELQGSLNRLVAHQSLLEVPLGVADVWHVVGALHTPAPPAPPASDEFEAFLSDLATSVAESVETWRVRLGERIVLWSAEGFRTDRLSRALERHEPQDVEALEAAMAADVERLRWLESEAVRLDPRCAGLELFRDPERVADAEDFLAKTVARTDPLPGPRPGLRLNDLVRTPDNRVVIQAASAIVEAPGSRYNPLFVHGPAGAGISHLAHAVGNALRTRDGGTWCIACVDAGDYVEQLIDALQQGAIERWRARYRAADVLIVENVQALDGKERTQDEFFHLFNELQQAGRQMILTCDRPLAQLTGLQSRLRSRFEGGLVAEMGPEQADERFGRDTPVPVGDEAAAPTIDVLLDRTPTPPVGLEAVDFDALAREPHAVDSFFLDAEKVVLDWPGIDGRVVEELR